MAKDGTRRGGARPGAGKKKKSLQEKIETGNPGGRKLQILDIPIGFDDPEAVDMPEPMSYLSAMQRDGKPLGADEVYKKKEPDPRIAVEVLIGHGACHIIGEASVYITQEEAEEIVRRIAGEMYIDCQFYPQDTHLADNQEDKIRCGDNGIFKGMPVTEEQRKLTYTSEEIYTYYPTDGKYILDGNRLIICQSNAPSMDIMDLYPGAEINPIGEWTGGPDVDTGATNRKLGSDMADSVTGGGLHGKDLSKADVSVNIYCWLKAQSTGKPVEVSCAIGDVVVGGVPYSEIVEIARNYIKEIGGFEKFAELGLLR